MTRLAFFSFRVSATYSLIHKHQPPAGGHIVTLTKNHLVQNIQKATGISKVQSKRIVEDLFELLKENLANGEDVLISGFGKFCVRAKNGRKGRNPATGEDLMLDSRKVVRFNCSGVLRDKTNGSG
jgi:integration host factor subunit alpha